MSEQIVEKVSRETQAKYKGNFLGDDGQLFLVRCAACHRENYAMAVAAGVCAWCGWRDDDE